MATAFALLFSLVRRPVGVAFMLDPDRLTQRPSHFPAASNYRGFVCEGWIRFALQRYVGSDGLLDEHNDILRERGSKFLLEFRFCRKLRTKDAM